MLCFTGTHLSVWVPIGVVATVVLCLAPPVVAAAVLWRHRNRLDEDAVVHAYGFMYTRYRCGDVQQYGGWGDGVGRDGVVRRRAQCKAAQRGPPRTVCCSCLPTLPYPAQCRCVSIPTHTVPGGCLNHPTSPPPSPCPHFLPTPL